VILVKILALIGKMKTLQSILFTVGFFLTGISSLHAQNIEGTEFWLTFGANRQLLSDDVDLQIRIVSGNEFTTGIIHFTNLGHSVPFNIAALQVRTYSLNDTEKEAVYNRTTGVSFRTIHITTDKPVTVYALNQHTATTDATNILPVMALEDDYYHISYATTLLDAYAVIATKNNTQLYHNGTPVTTLEAGQVYYHTSSSDMTGAHITSNNPVAVFALNKNAQIPADYKYGDCLMQQMAPTNTWGRNFFVPVSHLSKDIVRIVASQDNTNITQTGGRLLYPEGGQTSLEHIQAGQFVELEVCLDSAGCYIQSNKPIGVCTYLTSGTYNNPESNLISDPAQSWLSAIEQSVTNALIAPFIPTGITALNAHHALLVTPTATKEETRVSIGGALPVSLSDGNWIDNATAGTSFYNMPLTDDTASYRFTNDAGLIILCYGIGDAESYYYLAGSAMRDLTAAFFAKEVHYQDLPEELFCIKEIDFRADIKGLDYNTGSLKWYIDKKEVVSARDQLTWNRTFDAGEYEIGMWVRYYNNDTILINSVINIGAIISTSESPPQRGITTGDGCYKVGGEVNIMATPNQFFKFVNWTEEEIGVSTDTAYSFIATEDRSLVANFALDFDIYAVIICDRIILLNLKKLAEDGFEVTGSLWFKNGIEVTDTHTADPFSYAEGDGKLLENAPTYYMFCLITEKYGELCSTEKIILKPAKAHGCPEVENSDNLLAFPNPVWSGNLLTLVGIVKNSPVYVYNHLGICVFSFIATESITTIAFDFPQGIYLLRNGEKMVRVVVVK
jgi:hypothetical protein